MSTEAELLLQAAESQVNIEGISPQFQQQQQQSTFESDEAWLWRIALAFTVFFAFIVLSFLVPRLLKWLLFKVFCLREVHQVSSGVHVYREIRSVCGRMSNCRAGKDLWEAAGVSIPGCHKDKRKKSHAHIDLSSLYVPDRVLGSHQCYELEGRAYDDLGELFCGRVRSYYITFCSMILGMAIFLVGLILFLYILQVDIYTLLASLGLLALIGAILIRDTASNFVAGLAIMKNNLVESGDYIAVGSYYGWVCLVKSTHTTLYTRCNTECKDGTKVRVEFIEVPNSVLFTSPFRILSKGWDSM